MENFASGHLQIKRVVVLYIHKPNQLIQLGDYKMTKMEIVNQMLHTDFTSISDRLNKLMEEGRITTGARYYVYDPYHIYSYTQLNDILSKACKSSNYTRYIKRIDSITFSVMWESFQDDLNRILSFIEEQENLPFEQSQKQVLIQSGELNN